jgi:hypothetical protein
MDDSRVTDAAARRAGLAPGTRVLITMAAAVVALVGVWLARDILAPAAVAAVVVIIAHPVRFPLERRGWPRWLATTVVIAVAYAILAVLAVLLVVASAQFVRLLPDYADELETAAESIAEAFASLGLSEQASAAAGSVLDPGALVNVAGAGILRTTDRADMAQRLVDYLLGPGQEYFAAETYEYPLVDGVEPGSELPPLSELQGPDVALGAFGEELAATLELLDSVGLTS